MKRKLAGKSLDAVGLGCMNLSHAYGEPLTPEDGKKLLHRALDLGVDHFDTAALYGAERNEKLLGPVLKSLRNEIFLASKGGMRMVNGAREIDGRPELIKQSCEQSLRNLQTDRLDLYYLHRWDLDVPLDESVGALMELKQEGKILAIGLSEVPADALTNVHAQYPIDAVQSEYSLWSRNPEIAVLKSCEALGIAFVAFSPLGRGFLADLLLDPDQLVENDIRRGMPRFQAEHFKHNAALRDQYADIANRVGCTPAQLGLAWLLQKSPAIHVIPGTTSSAHLEENMAASEIALFQSVIEELDELINQHTVSGGRYAAGIQKELKTEVFVNELNASESRSRHL